MAASVVLWIGVEWDRLFLVCVRMDDLDAGMHVEENQQMELCRVEAHELEKLISIE